MFFAEAETKLGTLKKKKKTKIVALKDTNRNSSFKTENTVFKDGS